MKIKDSASISGHLLLVQFLATGDMQHLSSIRLDRGLSISVGDDKQSLYAMLHETGKRILIDTFSTSQLASNALQEVRHQISRYHSRRRLITWATGFLKWGVAPLIALVFVLSLNTIATGVLVSDSSVAVQYPPARTVEPDIAAALPRADNATVQRPEPAALARALEAGANSGKYSVHLSNGPKGTLYVFSDPSCPYCRRLEPVLESLAGDYRVVVFPVSVVGGEQTQGLLKSVFCAPAAGAERSEAWKSAAQGIQAIGPDVDCAEATEAIAANDEFFRAMNFPGTPTIINAAGMEFPTNRRADAENLAAWAGLEQKAIQ